MSDKLLMGAWKRNNVFMNNILYFAEYSKGARTYQQLYENLDEMQKAIDDARFFLKLAQERGPDEFQDKSYVL